MNRKTQLFLTLSGIILFPLFVVSQRKWTGIAGDGQWSTATNWTGNSIPIAADDVVLDNEYVSGTYIISLPSTSVTTSINSLQITPFGSNNITLVIPSTNTANPGLNVTGIVSGSDGIIINYNGILKNSTGAGPGNVGIVTSNKLRINNGGRYVHNNIRAHASILDQLSSVGGTEYGIWEFDVPGTTGYTVSISGRIYGTLIFSATSAGAPRTYTGNAANTNDLTIKGNLEIAQQATFQTTQNSNLKLFGDLIINGVFNFSPQSNSPPQRSLNFVGATTQKISGSGAIQTSSYFNRFDVASGSVVQLQRDVSIGFAENIFIVRTGGTLWMDTYKVYGGGTFEVESNGKLGLGSPDGISLSPSLTGNVQTSARIFHANAIYEYYGSQSQQTGDGLPNTLTNNLIINNASSTGVTLSKSTSVSGLLTLSDGVLYTHSANLCTLTASGRIASNNHNYTNLAYTNMGSDASFVDGPIEKQGLSNETFAFPVGKINMHRPLILQEASGDFIIEYFRANPQTVYGTDLDPSIALISSLEYWTVNASSANPSAKVELTFYDPNSGGVVDVNALLVAEWDDVLWNNKGASAVTGTAGTNGSVTSIPITDFFPPFTLAGNSAVGAPLNVPIIGFKGFLVNRKVRLEWSIANGFEFSGLEIERSADGTHFGAIHSINELTIVNNIWDNFPLPGTNFYRLKIIEQNGEETKSRIIRINNSDVYGILVYPNPAQKEIFVNLPTSSSNSTIEIVNTSGQVIKKVSTSDAVTKINIDNLIKGLYFIRLCSDQGTITRKFIKD